MSRHTTGNSRPYIVATSYRHESPRHARWERPEGEPSLFTGGMIVLAVFVLLAAIGAILP